MVEPKSGTQVHHVSLGVGKVVAADAEALHVFFPASHSRYAAKLRLPAAHRFLRADGFEPDGWLGGLSAFEYDERAGRWGLTASWMTHDEAISLYLARKPQGFHAAAAGEAKAGAPDRRARWAAATAYWRSHLGEGEGERLLEEGELPSIIKKILALEKLVAPLLGPADQGALAETLVDLATAAPYLRSLFQAVSAPAPGRARFEALFRTTRALPGAPAQRWLVATLLPFIANPERHVLLRPRATGQALERLGSALTTTDVPAWAPYSSLRTVSTRLLEALAPHGAKDFADVECFLHATATAKPAAKADPPPRPPGGRQRHGQEQVMNDDFRDFKARIRKLDEMLKDGGVGHLPFAQALSAVQRAARHGDRTRQPSPELKTLLEKAESLSRTIVHT